MVGDAELDEGNVWEALAEEAVARLGNVLWIVDVNRQSLDRIVPDARRSQLPELFAAFGWNVIELRYGSRLQQPSSAARAASDCARVWTRCRTPSTRASCASRGRGAKGAGDRRRRRDRRAIDRLLRRSTTRRCAPSLGDLGGHDLALILDALDEAEARTETDQASSSPTPSRAGGCRWPATL